MSSARTVVETYWEAADARDWDRFAATLAADVVYESPLSGERVAGRSAYVRFNAEGFTDDWRARLERVVAEERAAVSWVTVVRGDGARQTGVCFFELDADGRIRSLTDFWPDPSAVPSSRAHLVEPAPAHDGQRSPPGAARGATGRAAPSAPSRST